MFNLTIIIGNDIQRRHQHKIELKQNNNNNNKNNDAAKAVDDQTTDDEHRRRTVHVLNHGIISNTIIRIFTWCQFNRIIW